MNREPFTTLTAVAAPLRRANVDTDAIIPGKQLLKVSKEGFGPGLFHNWRYRDDGSEDPGFILNQDPYREAQILLAGRNFACGSSREVAVWALRGYGFRCVIAPSFANIFYANAFKNGLLPITLEERQVEQLADEVEAGGGREPITVDLVAGRVTSPEGESISFRVPEIYRQAMIEALEPISATLRFRDDIITFQKRDRRKRSWVYFGRPPIETASFEMTGG